MKKTHLIFLFFFCCKVFAQQTEKWGDLGDGTYANPILPGDYSDIDAIRVDSDYYAISSTFQFSPGVIILHSKDLINWQILDHVADDLNRISPELNWDRMNRYGRGIWAGAIRHHRGKFWVYFCTPEEGIFMSTATKPEGPWQHLYKIWGIAGWDDCCPFWDEDGQGYLVASNFKNKYEIHLFKLSEDGMRLDFHSDSVIHQSSGSEANKLYKIHGYYYHFYSEVNSEGRVAMMERSRNIYGPFEIKQLNHVNPSKDKEPNQGALIQNASGDWWFLTHQGTGDWEGRAVCLLPVFWIKDWPVIGDPGADSIGNMVWACKKPILGQPVIFPQTDDDFNQDSLSVQWEWNYQPRKEKWSLSERRGFLRLHAFIPVKTNNKNKYNLFFKAGNTLTQRCMRTPYNEVRIKLDIAGMTNGQRAGLVHFSGTYCSIGVKQESGIRSLIYEVDGREVKGPTIKNSSLWLKSVWGYAGISQFAYSLDGKKYTRFGRPYQLGWGFYRGDRIGIFSYNKNHENGYVDVDFFNYDFAGVLPIAASERKLQSWE